MSKTVCVAVYALVFLCVLAGFAGRVSADTTVNNDISSNVTWTKAGSPYVISKKIYINPGRTLTIEPGVSVKIDGQSSQLRVSGTLAARGNSNDGIYFDALNGVSTPIESYGGNVNLSYVTLSARGSIYGGDKAHVDLDHVRMSHSGIVIWGGFLVANNSIFESDSDAAIYVYVNGYATSTATVRNSVFSGKSRYALSVASGVTVDVRNNFWGDASGPYHSTLNPTGKGKTLFNSSGRADFSPWLTRDPFACCSSVLFLSGFEGSRLYVSDDPSGAGVSLGENRLWEPNRDKDIESLGLNPSGESLNKVYAKTGDVLDEAYISLAGPNIYKSFIADMNALVATRTISDWLPAAYDWRLSLDQLLERGSVSSGGMISYLDSTSTPYVVQEFYRLAQESKTGRVSVVAHSNGGLLAKALLSYVESRGDADMVDKIILVAVPQTGTPHAVGALLHGFKEGIWPFTSPQAMRRLGQNMPGAYSLLPSLRYIDSSVAVIKFSATTSSSSLVDLRKAYGDGIRLFSTLTDFLKGGEGRRAPSYANLSTPETLNPLLLDRASAMHATLDAWIPYPSSELFEIGGRNLDTVSGIEYYEGRKDKKPELLYRPLFYSDGDGTVMLSSAWATPSIRNDHKYWVDLRLASTGLNLNRDHSNILEIPDLRDFIRELLSEAPHEIRHRAQIVDFSIPPLKLLQKTVRVLLHSTDASLGVTDRQGRHTGRLASTGLVETQIPGSQYREFGEVKYVSIPDPSSGDSAPVIQVVLSDMASSVPETSFSIDVEEAVDDEVATSSTFEDISIPAGAMVTVVPIDVASSSTTPILTIDEDGDGVVDREVLPGEPASEEGEPLATTTPDTVPDPRPLTPHESDHRRIVFGATAPGAADLLSFTSTSPTKESSSGPITRVPSMVNVQLPAPSTLVVAGSAKTGAFDVASGTVAKARIPSLATYDTANMAALYIASNTTTGPITTKKGILLIILAFLVGTCVLWFLSCKISKSG